MIWVFRPPNPINSKSFGRCNHIAVKAARVIAVTVADPRVFATVLRIEPEIDFRKVDALRRELNFHLAYGLPRSGTLQFWQRATVAII